ncbi:MAG: Gfo/Idh/MocA family oxidoreductase [Planctomycetota bacterium]|nr:Gfo/Idh/MocA family oxidoreductase [Planctomycetota bacterium]
MSDPIGVGVIGLGFMGRTHLGAYEAARKNGSANTVVAVCDQDPDLRAGKPSGQTVNLAPGAADKPLFDPDSVHGYADPDELLADPAVDLVSICTYTPTHVPLALKALAAGKHVLVEKPVALCEEDAMKLVEAAKDAGTVCMPAMCMRFWPGWSWLHDRVRDGSLGDVRAASFQRLGGRPAWGGGFYEDDDSCGGALFDLHVHDADFLLHCFGLPDAVASHGTSRHVTSVYHYGDGPRSAVAEGGWLPSGAFPFQMRYRIVFESSVADFDLARDPQLILYEDGGERTIELPDGDGYSLEIAHLLSVIRGEVELRATLDDALVLTRLLERERESLRDGRTVEL